MSKLLGESAYKRGLDAVTGTELSRASFSILMAAVLFWGFIINAIICIEFGWDIVRWSAQGANYAILLFGYLVLALVGIAMSNKSSNPVISFIGYNLVVLPMGALLAVLMTAYDMQAIRSAFIATAVMCVVSGAASSLFPQLYQRMGGALFIALIGGLVAQLICMLIAPGMVGIFDWIFTIVFSLYIGFDWYRAQNVAPTADNAVDCACSLYVDIINLFIRLVAIFGRK